MNCALSGEIPQEPVVSRKTGHIFERRLIEKHLASSNTCPITGGELSTEDLIAVKSDRTVPPRDITATSIPGMLSLFQKEWDAVMMESFTLKKTMRSLRNELCQALYQHDAACRVIARLIKERDQAVAAYQDVQKRAAVGGGGGGGGAVAAAAAGDSPVPAAALAAMRAKAAELKTMRQQRSKPATIVSKEKLASLAQTSHHTPHGASKPGITCIDLHKGDQNMVATGGVDKNIKVFNRKTKKVVATVSGHSKKVTSVEWHPSQPVIFSGSEDATVRVWARDGKKYPEKVKFTGHTGAVTGISVHPTGAYVASSSIDGSWRLHDCAAGSTITTAEGAGGDGGLSALGYHPDGLILGTGDASGTIALWDMTNAAKAQRSLAGHTGAITALHFSENGYHLASSSVDGTVRLWDLRKFTNPHTLEVGAPVNCVRFNHSGTYLACGATDVRVLHTRKWTTHATLGESNGAPVMGVALTSDADVLASVSMDRNLRLYSVA